MTKLRLLTLFMAVFVSPFALAGPPAVGTALPSLSIDDRGELTLQAEELVFSPWHSSVFNGGVHVVQYFGATMGDSEKFKPFTDILEKTFAAKSVEVTTVINMDAALWGTGGFVLSEVKKNKKRYPDSTIVIDEDGIGVKSWELGKAGSALVIIDAQGTVLYINQNPLTDEELATTVALLQAALDS